MLLKYFGLQEQPFGVTPDPRYLYETDTHREALASILYSVEAGRGFTALIADPGMGKTTLLFRALQQSRWNANTVFLFQSVSTPLEFMRMLLLDLGVQDHNDNLFELQTKLNRILLEYSGRGERLVVVIDEAQNLDHSVLEFLRMLSNFETPQRKLVEIVLSGQPELARKLASPGFVQLRQRVSIVASLQAFSAKETERYVNHRLRIAGYASDSALFTAGALRLIAKHSGGVPRNINNLCFNALSLACALNKKIIDADILRQVIEDLDLGSLETSLRFAAESKPARAVITPRSSILNAWLPRVAIAGLSLLALSGTSLSRDSRMTVLAKTEHTTIPKQEAAASQLAQAVQSTAAVAPSLGATHFKRRFDDLRDTLRVPAGATLYGLCTEKLGACHSKELRQIRRLNPWLTDPDHLEAGRILRIPSASVLSAVVPAPVNSLADRPSAEVTTK